MPEGEGTFDGDGSVKWEVRTEKDKDNQSGSVPDGPTGRKSFGLDADCETYFRVILKTPTDPDERKVFLQQFNVPEVDGAVEVRLPIEAVAKQVRVKWDGKGPIGLKS